MGEPSQVCGLAGNLPIVQHFVENTRDGPMCECSETLHRDRKEIIPCSRLTSWKDVFLRVHNGAYVKQELQPGKCIQANAFRVCTETIKGTAVRL